MEITYLHNKDVQECATFTRGAIMQETINSKIQIVENDKNTCSWIGGASIGPSTPSQGILVVEFVSMQRPNVGMETQPEQQLPAHKLSPNHQLSKYRT